VIIITFLSLLGAVFFPCLNDQIVQYILSMFIAMGAATLVGDALLHLLPQVNLLSDDMLCYSGGGVIYQYKFS